MSEPVAKPALAWRITRFLFRQLVRLLALFGAATLLFIMCLDYTRMTSPSMQPTIQGTDWETGDRVLTEKVSYWLRQPRRWEVIAFENQEGTTIMKRVIGLPGEQIQMLPDGQLIADGQELTPPAELAFLDYVPDGNLASGEPPVACGDGLYLLGDDSADSDDSRNNGPVAPDQVIGRAWLILGPSGRRGLVNP